MADKIAKVNASKEELQLILNTLEQIEVKGMQNLDMLLGCMQMLKSIIGRKEESNAEQNEIVDYG